MKENQPTINFTKNLYKVIFRNKNNKEPILALSGPSDIRCNDSWDIIIYLSSWDVDGRIQSDAIQKKKFENGEKSLQTVLFRFFV